jgi:hypothetical protein
LKSRRFIAIAVSPSDQFRTVRRSASLLVNAGANERLVTLKALRQRNLCPGPSLGSPSVREMFSYIIQIKW